MCTTISGSQFLISFYSFLNSNSLTFSLYIKCSVKGRGHLVQILHYAGCSTMSIKSLSEPALWHRPQKMPDSKAILVLLHLYLPNLTLYFFCLKSILYKDILQLPLKCMETITLCVCVCVLLHFIDLF